MLTCLILEGLVVLEPYHLKIMLNRANENLVINRINTTVKDDALKKFLVKLIKSDVVNENLLCLCILVDLKYFLLEENQYVTIINDIISLGIIVDFHNFTNAFILDRTKIIFACDYSCHSCCDRKPFSRTVDLNTFNLYIGGYDHEPSRLRFREELEISEDKINTAGWSSGNGVVWVTPSHKVNWILDIAETDAYQADKICDHVGWARTDVFFDKTGGHFVLINYSEDFDDKVYQPNSTNAGFQYPDTLFVSYNNDNGFGLTYNENSVEYAKEQIHEKSSFFDDKFEAIYVGEMSVDTGFTRSDILDEAMARLNIW